MEKFPLNHEDARSVAVFAHSHERFSGDLISKKVGLPPNTIAAILADMIRNEYLYNVRETYYTLTADPEKLGEFRTRFRILSPEVSNDATDLVGSHFIAAKRLAENPNTLGQNNLAKHIELAAFENDVSRNTVLDALNLGPDLRPLARGKTTPKTHDV